MSRLQNKVALMRELIEAGFSRRDLFKMGLLTGAGYLVAKGGLSARADEQTQLRGGQSMIFMVPKFTGAAYFAATEKGAKEAVAELKGKGVAIDFLYTGPSVANTDEEIRMIDDLVAQKPDRSVNFNSERDNSRAMTEGRQAARRGRFGSELN